MRGLALKDNSGCFQIVLAIAIATALIYVGIYAIGGSQSWYSILYRVPASKVQIKTRPKDCDFMHAPMGDKGCHYVARVYVYNADGNLIAGDEAPRYSYDNKTRKPIISWDKGQTWDWTSGSDIPDQNADSVIVSWSKVND